MIRNEIVGSTVALVGCPAQTMGEFKDVQISGLWAVEEFHPYEPSAYVFSPCFTLYRDGEAGPWGVTVDADDLWQQIDPKGWAGYLADMAWQALHEDAAHEAFCNDFEGRS